MHARSMLISFVLFQNPVQHTIPDPTPNPNATELFLVVSSSPKWCKLMCSNEKLQVAFGVGWGLGERRLATGGRRSSHANNTVGIVNSIKRAESFLQTELSFASVWHKL